MCDVAGVEGGVGLDGAGHAAVDGGKLVINRHHYSPRVSTVGSIATRDFKDVRACDLAPLLAPMDSSACISLSLEVRGPQTIRLPPN